MKVEDIVKAYADELSNWEFFSDSQRCYLDDEDRIVVCLRDYEWFKTKEKITDPLTAVKALFEIDWIAEYVYDSEYIEGKSYIKNSKYWEEA